MEPQIEINKILSSHIKSDAGILSFINLNLAEVETQTLSGVIAKFTKQKDHTAPLEYTTV